LSKEITARRLYIETMEEVLNSANTGSITLIDKTLENFLPVSQFTTQGGEK
jgi:hypothetical protein